jgi:hypothetical protein
MKNILIKIMIMIYFSNHLNNIFFYLKYLRKIHILTFLSRYLLMPNMGNREQWT